MYQLDPGVRNIFPELYCKCQLKGKRNAGKGFEENDCNVPWAILLDPTAHVTFIAQDAGQQSMATS